MGKVEMERVRAVERYSRGESAAAISASIGRSVRWVYKWIERSAEGGEWWTEHSRKAHRAGNRSSPEVERLIVEARRRLVSEGGFEGAQMIAWELENAAIAVPSIATINRVLKRHGLIESAGRRPVSKGKRYPAPEAVHAGVHQSDFVGPRFLRGPVRFYSLNTVDVATARCATVPIPNRSTEAVVPALWETWLRLGIPRIQQLDNELVFFGSRLHPRGLSQVLRLCLLHDVAPLFIPPSEPWRNGVIEKFNDHWQQKFLTQPMSTLAEAQDRSRAFDERHNSRWRYRKIGGKTPNEALRAGRISPQMPPQIAPPSLPLPRPKRGRYHFIRFIRSDRSLDLFGEKFALPAEAAHEYVQATVDVETQRLDIRIDQQLIETFHYAVPK
jgi:putative transposase